MAERVGRQTFAPKVAGSSPTGALCERRGEKSLSGLFRMRAPVAAAAHPVYLYSPSKAYRNASGAACSPTLRSRSLCLFFS